MGDATEQEGTDLSFSLVFSTHLCSIFLLPLSIFSFNYQNQDDQYCSFFNTQGGFQFPFLNIIQQRTREGEKQGREIWLQRKQFDIER